MSKKFKIPPLKLPTYDEHRAASLSWLERARPALIDQWPADLSALSMPTKLIEIDARGVFDAMWALYDGKPHAPILTDLAAQIDADLGWHRKFFRLNSRSPKDAPWPFETIVSMSGKEIVSVIASSERVLDDLKEFSYLPEQKAYIALRDHVPEMRGHNEFRCFVKDGDLIAVTHYDYHNSVPEWVMKNSRDIRLSIDAYFSKTLKPTLHVDTIVFDIAIMGDDIMLIEINPYGSSDPCWFESYANVESACGDIQIEYVSANTLRGGA